MDREIKRKIPDDMTYPSNILYFNGMSGKKNKTIHPAEKPVNLLEYLLKTYTLKGDLVLDNCMGSGSTIIAANNLKRSYIGIEKEKIYYDVVVNRLKESNIMIK